ncbi:MAG: transketolase [Bacilli bacterium]|nr:transketolase [Bacilli bacterium]
MAKAEIFPEKKIIDNMKALSIDLIDNAGSGHPGIALGAASIIYTLYGKHMNFNTNDDKWINRDRFVLSAGHGSALLYTTLYMAGFNLTIDDLKAFRKIGSKTPGHPEYNVTPGVDVSTGPLGQGFASAVGMAIAGKNLAATYNSKKKNAFDKTASLFDYNTYVLCGDGDLMEGVTYEAASLAGTLKLDNLIVLYDSNDISLDGKTELTFTENVIERFSSMGWHTQVVKDGENVNEIDKAIIVAKKANQPAIIQIKTTIGKGSLIAGTNAVHGTPLTKEDISQLKEGMGVRNIPFTVSKEATEAFRKMIVERTNKKYKNWADTYNLYIQSATDMEKQSLALIGKNNVPSTFELSKIMWKFDPELKEAMREVNGKIMKVIADNVPNFMGGSADLSSSTKTNLNDYSILSPTAYNGRNIYFGVREHAMGTILNGLSLSGFRPFGSTFLAFSDYLKPSIRMAALMNLPVTYIFTHDSVNIGSDGPTHQPIEQLAMLRSVPNLYVYRPADAKEVVGAWDCILKSCNPCALIISRNETRLLKDTSVENVKQGAYIIKKEKVRLTGIIIATGSEVHMAEMIANNLYEMGIDLRVISMVCMETFLKQPQDYRDGLIPLGYKTVVLEAGSSFGWHRFVYNDKYLMTIDKFGKSGTKDEVLEYCDFSAEILTKKIEKLFR